MANFLTPHSMNPLVLTGRPRLAVEEFADFWSFRANTRSGSVACGSFTDEADRPQCEAVLREMWLAKMEQLAAGGQRMMTTLFGVVEAKLLASAVDGPLRIVDAAGAPARWDSISRAWTLGDLSSGGGQEHPIGAPIVAAMLGDAALLREAFDERGADVAARHAATGATTVMHAAGAGAADAVDFLLNHAKARGLSRLVDAGTSKLGITPLDRAVRCGHADVVRLLLRHDASVAVARSSGCTPLHAAAEMGRCECAAALLQAGADVDAANHDGATPLHLCASGFTLFGSQAGKADVARLLLGHGARRDVRNRDGRTALDVAAAEANAAVAALLGGGCG